MLVNELIIFKQILPNNPSYFVKFPYSHNINYEYRDQWYTDRCLPCRSRDTEKRGVRRSVNYADKVRQYA